MVKIDLITGFLGSGKTTFIKKYAKYLMDTGENICIIRPHLHRTLTERDAMM